MTTNRIADYLDRARTEPDEPQCIDCQRARDEFEAANLLYSESERHCDQAWAVQLRARRCERRARVYWAMAAGMLIGALLVRFT